MRETLRNIGNKAYWEKRWRDIELDQPMENEKVYPLKYALLALRTNKDRILEIGCGAGRILKWFHQRNFDIIGVDFIGSVITRLKNQDASLRVNQADVLSLPFTDEAFDLLLAFGLLHNLKIEDCRSAMQEISRVASPRSRLCISFRADNIQNSLLDWYKNKDRHESGERIFHKLNLTKNEFSQLVRSAGFIVEEIHAVENMPLLYQFPFFRGRKHLRFDENKGRIEGYHLSKLGNFIQGSLMYIAPNHWCNIYIIIAVKNHV